MENKNILENLTVIIPIHEFNKETDLVFINKCAGSILKNRDYLPKEVLIVHTKEFSEYGIDMSVFGELNIKLFRNETDNTDFSSQINIGAKNVTTDYFSILEFDDDLSDIYFMSFNEYSSYYNSVSIFLPIIIEVNEEEHFIKFTNAEGISRGIVQEGELGLLSHQNINSLTSLLISGAFIKTEDYNSTGGLKSNMKISFIHEFLLRATYLEQKVFVIPKFAYLHRNGRQGSYLDLINQSNVSKEEVMFWYEAARREFYYNRDREISYSPELVINK